MVTEARPVRVIGRYAVFDAIASGGMATIHIGRLMATAGFSRTVAVKRLHANLARDPEFVAMFIDEARLAARIRHSNVIQTLDVVALEGELFVVMDYVAGDSLAAFLKQAKKGRRPVQTGSASGPLMPLPIAAHVVCDALHGLHAAHEAKSERGDPLGIVHRDVSPQNVLIGLDGVARVFDFGVALALGRVQSTPSGQVKGKHGYMAPEQFRGEPVTRRSDLYSAGIVLWEAITGERLFPGATEAEVIYQALQGKVAAPSTLVGGVPPAFEAALLRALEKDPEKRFATALEMAVALEGACAMVSPRQVAAWAQAMSPDGLAQRAAIVAAVESAPTTAAVDQLARRNSSRPAPPADESPHAAPATRSSAPSAATLADAVPRKRPAPLVLAGAAVLVVAAAAAMAMSRANGPAAPNDPALAATGAPSAAVSAPSATAPPASSPEPEPEPSPTPASAATSSSSPSVAPAQPSGSGSATAKPTGSAPASGTKKKRADELMGRD